MRNRGERLVWQGPDEGLSRGQRGYWVETLAPLVERPGEWARIAEKKTPQQARTVAANFRLRAIRIPRPDDTWQFVSRTRKKGHSYIYARYLGPEEQA